MKYFYGYWKKLGVLTQHHKGKQHSSAKPISGREPDPIQTNILHLNSRILFVSNATVNELCLAYL